MKKEAPATPTWVHPDAEDAHAEWLYACKRKYYGLGPNEHAMDMAVPSWMRAV